MAIKFLMFLSKVPYTTDERQHVLVCVFVYGCVCGCACIFAVSPSQEISCVAIRYYFSQCIRMPRTVTDILVKVLFLVYLLSFDLARQRTFIGEA